MVAILLFYTLTFLCLLGKQRRAKSAIKRVKFNCCVEVFAFL